MTNKTAQQRNKELWYKHLSELRFNRAILNDRLNYTTMLLLTKPII